MINPTGNNVEVPVKFTFSAVSSNKDDDRFRIEIHDPESCITFCQVELSHEEAAKAILGNCGYVDGKAKLFSPELVGLVRESKEFVFPMPEHGYRNRREVAVKEAKRLAPEGWKVDTFFRSQNSFFKGDSGRAYARTQIMRWVKPRKQLTKEGD